MALRREAGVGLLVLALASVAHGGEAKAVQLVNPGFELGADRDGVPEGWTERKLPGSLGVNVDRAVSKEGNCSVRIESIGYRRSNLSQVLRVEPGGLYRLTGWVRTKDYKPRKGGVLFATFAVCRLAPNVHPLECGKNHTGTTDWVQETLDFIGPPGGRITIDCVTTSYAAATGSVWFDDIRLARLAGRGELGALAKPPHGCVACMEWALQRRPVDWPALISALETLQAEDAWKRAHDGVDAHLDALRAATQADRKVCRLVVALCGRVGLKMRGDELARLDLPGLVQEPTEEMVNDPKLAARVRVVLARAIALDAGKPITAAAEAMQAAVGSDAGQRSRLADVLVRDAGLLYGTKDHERAERLYDLSLRFADPKSPRRAAIESTRLKFLTDTGKAQAARQAAERLAAPDRRVPSKIRKEALLTLAKLSVDADDVGEAARWARDADRQLAGDRATLAEFHLDYAKALSGRERWPDAAAECQKLVAVFPGQTRACFEAQALAVRCLMQHRQYGDALAAAKVLYDVAPNSEKEITEAVNLVMQALKGKYRSIALANDFVAFQSHGPDGEDGKKGTEDDVEDPLVKVQWTPPPEIEALFKKTVAGLPQDFQGRRWRGYLYLYWGKPELALKEFAWRYDHAPLEQKAIDEAIDDLVVALKACCGHALAGERFLDYQKYGPKGRDGKAGTADDLTDPLKEILGKR